MNDKFVEIFNKHKEELDFSKHPENYGDLVKKVIQLLSMYVEEYSKDDIDPERIHEINDGNYQGTLLFVIASRGYQPSEYWYVKVDYGSCSGCDTLEAIRNYQEEVTIDQKDQYLTLCLHIIQGLKKME